MAIKNYNDWTKDRPLNLPPVLAFGGNQRSRVDEAVAATRRHTLKQAADFNHDRFNGGEAELRDIIQAAKTLPMMAEKRLVEVRQSELLKGELEALINYLSSPCISTVLILIFDHIDQRLKLPKILQTHNVLYVFDPPKEYEMPQIAADYARRYGLKLNSDAITLLTLMSGSDISLLENILLKLSVAVPSGVVREEDILAHIKNDAIQDAFMFGRLVAHGNTAQAVLMMCRLRTAKEIPLKLVGLLAWQLRQVVRSRSLLDQGNRDSTVEKQLGLFAKNRELLQVAKKSTLAWHVNRLIRLSQLDRDLKSLPGSPWLHFEHCIIELCESHPLPNG